MLGVMRIIDIIAVYWQYTSQHIAHCYIMYIKRKITTFPPGVNSLPISPLACGCDISQSGYGLLNFDMRTLHTGVAG